MRQRRVGDVMTTDVVTVDKGAGFKDIARILREERITGVPVVDEDRRVMGVISESDLLRKEEYKVLYGDRAPALESRRHRVARAKAAGDVAVELMSAPPVTVTAATPVVEAARLMGRHEVNRLPVVDERGVLVGIVTRSDLLSVFLRSDVLIRHDVVDNIIVRVLWEDPSRLNVEVHDGVVTLAGQVELRSTIGIAERLVRALDGVVDVVNRLSYATDDLKRLTPSLRV